MSSVGSNAPESRHLDLIQASISGDEKRIRAALETPKDSRQTKEDVESSWQSQKGLDALRTALQRVSALGKLNLVELLLKHGAEVNTKRDNEVSALFRAAENGRIDVLRLLVEHGAEVETTDRYGRTPVFPAAIKGFVDVLDLLFNAGAQADAKDTGGRTALLHVAAEKSTQAWTDKQEHVLICLLRAGADIEAQDASRRTALMWAASTNRIHLARFLLSGQASRKCNINAIQNRSRTAMHFAAEVGHRDMVELLLSHGANIQATSDGGWTALHNAAERGHVETVYLLLAHEAPVNAQLSNGMSALHWAAFNGHSDIVQLIIDRLGVNIALRDSFNRTPMLCAAEKGHLQIARMLSPARNGARLTPAAVQACKGFEATIVDFAMDSREGRQRVFKHSVHDLLYEFDNPEMNRARVPILAENVKHRPAFRWIHLPANNMTWFETLLAKHFIEKGAKDIDDFKSFEKALGQEHRGPTTHSYFMRTACQKAKIQQSRRLQVNGSEPSDQPSNILIPKIIEPSTVADKTPEPVALPSTPEPKSPHNGQPTSNKKRRGKKEEHGVDKPAKKATKDGVSPAPNKTNKASTQSSHAQRGRVDRTKLLPETAVLDANVLLFMPFLHYETDQRRVEMSEAISRAKSNKPLPALQRDTTADDHLIQGYLKTNPPLHIRRTLDQFFYHGIDTAERDRDQVTYRYCRRRKIERKIFMVDQLWMWVLGGDLIITAFPQRWNQPKNDPLNVLDGIIEDLNAKTRPPVKSVYDVAMTITSRCSGMFDRHHLEREEYQFLDMFESSIGRVTDRETKLFDRFDRASAAAAKWLRMHRKSRGDRKTFSFISPDFDIDHLGNDPRFQDILLDIGVETQLLTEIKDIRDELNILLTILDHQRSVLKDLGEHLTEELGRRTDIGYEMTRRSRDQLKVIETNVVDIKRMDMQAYNIYGGITGLLDLKQKHANAFETRFSRDQATLTARQGQTILVFTLTTILFLPMSFIAAFFAINIQEFPKADDGTSALSLGYVTKYTFGIGLGISIPLIACALAVDDLSLLFRRALHRMAIWTQHSSHDEDSSKRPDVKLDAGDADGDSDDDQDDVHLNAYEKVLQKIKGGPRRRTTRETATPPDNRAYVREKKSVEYNTSERQFSPPLSGRSRSRGTQGSWIRRSMDPPRMQWADDVERGRAAYR